MTKEELAKTLNNRKYGEEITKSEQDEANKSDLVVIFGASDDLMEIRGAINDEVSLYDGGIALFINGKLYQNECDDDSCPHEINIQEKCFTIEAVCDSNDNYYWKYKTNIPHATFDILEERSKYCRGIVFNISEIQGENK